MDENKIEPRVGGQSRKSRNMRSSKRAEQVKALCQTREPELDPVVHMIGENWLLLTYARQLLCTFFLQEMFKQFKNKANKHT